jgi:hypothetical protein
MATVLLLSEYSTVKPAYNGTARNRIFFPPLQEGSISHRYSKFGSSGLWKFSAKEVSVALVPFNTGFSVP